MLCKDNVPIPFHQQDSSMGSRLCMTAFVELLPV